MSLMEMADMDRPVRKKEAMKGKAARILSCGIVMVLILWGIPACGMEEAGVYVNWKDMGISMENPCTVGRNSEEAAFAEADSTQLMYDGAEISGETLAARLAQTAAESDGVFFREEYRLPDGKSFRIDAQVLVPKIQELHHYHYMTTKPRLDDDFSNRILDFYFGTRRSEMEYQEADHAWIMKRSEAVGDYEIYRIYTPASGSTVWGEQGYMLEDRQVDLNPLSYNLLKSAVESKAVITVTEADALCHRVLETAAGDLEYETDYILAYGTQGRIPFYWIVCKRKLDGMIVNAYNDFVFQVDDNGIEKMYGVLYDVEKEMTPEELLSAEDAVRILAENIGQINSQNQLDFMDMEVVEVSRITLEYTVIQPPDRDAYITPVWRFCLGKDEEERNDFREKILAVDAFTGEVIQQERRHTF